MGDEKFTTDLFGDVTVLPSGRRGRPAHRWSQSSEDKVILGLAMGYGLEEIANGLGISVPTLRKYYFSAIKMREMHRTRFELWRAELLARQANADNTSALRDLGKIFEKRDRQIAAERLRAAQAGKDDGPVGKKEASRRAARDIASGNAPAGDWGDLLIPGGGYDA